jgi:hypothetical protein
MTEGDRAAHLATMTEGQRVSYLRRHEQLN